MHVLQPDPKTLLNRVLSSCLNGRSVSVLEAGGGSRTHLREQMLNIASVTTVDISAEQLARNTYADFKIEADLEKFEPERSYDVVIMFQVLEHLQNADRALENLARACADDGFVVVGSPYMRSFSGMVTRFTPHWFHVFFYRRILGWKTALYSPWREL